MSAEALDAVVRRAMDDAAFRHLLASDPAEALAGFDLTPEERSRFVSGGAQAERLEERLSKSDLSAAVSAKASSPTLGPSSRAPKRR